MSRHQPKGRSNIKSYCNSRAKKARRVLAMFYDKEDIQTSVGDMVADLMHLCESAGYDFLEQYDKGREHFNAELVGGEHG